MTFGRALIIAGMAAFFTVADDASELLVIVLIGWVCWQFTTDPLPEAVRDGLRRFKRDWSGQ